MTDEIKTLTYVYVDRTNDGRVFYVGKGTFGRCQSFKRNNKHTGISRKFGVNREIVFQSQDDEECRNLEIQLIECYKTFVQNPECNELACNFTAGGEGLTGKKHSQATKDLISFRLRNRSPEVKAKTKKQKQDKFCGRKFSKESRKRMSQGHQGLKHSNETRLKQSLRHRANRIVERMGW